MTQILFAILIITVIGAIAGIILSLASKFMAVPVDEKTAAIREALPGANCGSCGYSGCDGYAAAIASGEAEPNKCTPGGEQTAAALSDILGVTVKTQRKIAVIHCNHSCDKAKASFNYEGLASCTAESLIHGGSLNCKYGCLGFGDCAAVCDSNAIKIIDTVATVDKDLCKGCGKCVDACPKNLISVENCRQTYYISCNNNEKGAIARKECTVACIGCMKCQKTCEHGAITVTDFLAHIDNDKCIGCGKCMEVCPEKCIVKMN